MPLLSVANRVTGLATSMAVGTALLVHEVAVVQA